MVENKIPVGYLNLINSGVLSAYEIYPFVGIEIIFSKKKDKGNEKKSIN